MLRSSIQCMCVQWAKQNSNLGTACSSYLGCFLQFSKDEEEELSPNMFRYREVMTQISEWEEKAVEQLKELKQVRGSSKTSSGHLLYVASSLLCLSQVLLGKQQCNVLYQWCYFLLIADFLPYFLAQLVKLGYSSAFDTSLISMNCSWSVEAQLC